MLLLAFLDSPSIFFILATIRIVDCTFRRLSPASIQSHFRFLYMEQLFYFCLYGTERKRCLSLSSWLLTKLRVLFIVHEGNLCMGTDFIWLSPCCQQNRPGVSDGLQLWWRDSVQTLLTLSELQAERLSRATLVMIGPCMTRGAGISHSLSIGAIIYCTDHS